MRPRTRIALLAMLVAVAAGCGQTGPLALPESARPLERAPPAEQDPADDERQDER
jgi:predicted small lipoprotein YifL